MRFEIGGVSVDLIDGDRICLGVKEKKKPFEPNTLARWAECCQEGYQVLDVGAYSGLFSLVAAKLGAIPTAIEPMPDLVERMRENAYLNRVSFQIIEAAASAENGTARLGYNDRVPFTSGASLLREKAGGFRIVRTIALDTIRGLTNLAAIKIDVERAEEQVLSGALKLIAREQPILFIEVLDSDARRKVETLLPRYRSAAFLDNRNLIMEPL